MSNGLQKAWDRREFSRRERKAWWLRFVFALSGAIAGIRAADEGVRWYMQRAGMQTVEQAKVEHAAIVNRIEAKIDKLGDRIDAALLQRKPRR